MLFSIIHTLLLAAPVRGGRGGSGYAAPYDSTQGVPAEFFMFCAFVVGLFLLRLAWEYRDKIFKKK